MDEPELAGRTCLVTGGSRGIGRAISVRLAKAGANVAINYVGDEAAARETKQTVAAQGVAGALIRGDVSSPADVQAMVGAAEQALGPIDLLVCSAGIVGTESHTEITYEGWRRIMAVNVDGTFLPVMAVKDGMIARGYGRIVCISSIAALRPRAMQIAYSASKAAVIAFARSCAEAFGPHVRVNSIAPGLIETDMTAPIDPAARARMIEESPLKRIGRPEEIAELALFLLSDRSSFTTGQTYVASGGRATLP
jgi:3-oxoacyl-[acyl-carrier protein] reductase